MNKIIHLQDDNKQPFPRAIVQPIDTAFRLIAAIIVIASVDYQSLFPDYSRLAIIGSLLFVFLYSALCYLVSLSIPGSKSKDSANNPLAFFDVFILGIILSLVHFPPVTFVFVTMLIAVRAITLGGLRLLLMHIGAFVAGVVTILATLQPDIAIDTTDKVSMVVLLSLPTFLCFLAYKMNRQQETLANLLETANRSVLALKLNNYKLSKYLSPSLRKAILSGKRVALETQRKRVSIFFSDIQGFGELSEELETESLTEVLNLYLTEMSEIALKFGGTVDKFIGDAIMVFFGDPISRGVKDDCVACVSMALAMQKRMHDLHQRWQAQGIKQPLQVRMGINTGFCTVGNFGTENRMDYTLLGTEVNKANRLESVAAPGEILISRATYELVKDIIYCRSKGLVPLKGFNEPVEVFSVVDLRVNIGKEESCHQHSTQGFNMYIDLENIPLLEKRQIMSSLEKVYDQLRQGVAVETKKVENDK